MYKNVIKPILFFIDPEKVHHIVSSLLILLNRLRILPLFCSSQSNFNPILEKEVMGIRFPNVVGLAAGFDKNASLYQSLSTLGFGFIEIGTVTPKAQSGNPKPRLFRIPTHEALLNRMGFNNVGLEQVVENLKKNHKNAIIGGNIGKNKITSNDEATEDYKQCFEALFPYVHYFAVNVSSPNTPNLRALQDKKPLKELLHSLQELNHAKPKSKPILLKISPDLNEQQLLDVLEIVEETNLAGIIATNTTISRDFLPKKYAQESGGISGKPVRNRSTEIIRFLVAHRQKKFAIIGVGGIFSAQDALEKIESGADLVQIYSGFIYEGTKLISDINQKIASQNQSM